MVELVSQEEADTAIMVLNGQELPHLGAGGTPNGGGGLSGGGGGGGFAGAPGGMLPAQQTKSKAPGPAWSPPQARAAKEVSLTVKYAGDGVTPSDNLYISGLPSPQIDKETLEALFGGLGIGIQRSKILPDTAGRGSSAAMVQLGSPDEAASAIQTLNGAVFPAEMMGAPAVAAPPSFQKPQTQGGGGNLIVKYAGNPSTPSDNLYISNLPSDQVDQTVLNSLFSSLGFNVVRSRLIPDTRGSGLSAAMVQLGSQEEAAVAIEALNGQPLGLGGGGSGAQVASYTPPAAIKNTGAAANGSGNILTVRYAGSGEPSDNLYIMGLPSGTTDQSTLTTLFSSLGHTVQRCRVIPDTLGRGTCAGMVQVASMEEAAAAIAALDQQAF